MARTVLGARLETVSVTTRPAKSGESPGQFVVEMGKPRRELVKVPVPAEIAARGRDLAAIRSAGREALALRYQTDKVYAFVKREQDRVRSAQDAQKSAATELLRRQFGAARAAEFAKSGAAERLRARLARRILGERSVS